MTGERERQPNQQPEEIALPPELAEFLRNIDVACLMQLTDKGAAFIVKLPRDEIESLRGAVPILKRHELYRRPTAPVIRTLLYLFDQPHNPLALETYTNIGDDDQWATLEALANQASFPMLFYDHSLAHCLSKVVLQPNAEEIKPILLAAKLIFDAIPAEAYDFDQAKAEIVAATDL